MDQTTAAMIGALIGAGGAVAAQTVASIFTAQRESRRLRWEQERWLIERRRQNAVDQLERKSRLYGELMIACRTQMKLLQRAMKDWISEEDLIDGDEFHNLEFLDSQLALIGRPEIHRTFAKMMEGMLEFGSRTSIGTERIPPSEKYEEWSTLQSELRELSLSMEADLKVDRDALAALEAGSLTGTYESS